MTADDRRRRHRVLVRVADRGDRTIAPRHQRRRLRLSTDSGGPGGACSSTLLVWTLEGQTRRPTCQERFYLGISADTESQDARARRRRCSTRAGLGRCSVGILPSSGRTYSGSRKCDGRHAVAEIRDKFPLLCARLPGWSARNGPGPTRHRLFSDTSAARNSKVAKGEEKGSCRKVIRL